MRTMSNIPPPDNFANYPRPGTGPSAASLRNLADGYFGLNTAFLINIALNFLMRLLTTTTGQMQPGTAIILLIAIVLAMFVIVTLVTLPHNRKIGEGLGWTPSGPIIASVLIGLNSALCCGIVGYIVVQAMAAKKFKEAGAPRSFFGYKKAELYHFIDQLSMSHP